MATLLPCLEVLVRQQNATSAIFTNFEEQPWQAQPTRRYRLECYCRLTLE